MIMATVNLVVTIVTIVLASPVLVFMAVLNALENLSKQARRT